MSEPTNHPDRPAVEHPHPQDEPPKKGSSPILLILLLIAALALGWYFLSKRDPAVAPVEPVTPIGDTTDATDGAGDAAPPARDAAPRQRTTTPRSAARPADREARALNPVKPEYPAVALRSRIEGSVVVGADVDENGNATNVTVVRSSRSRDLDRAAVAAVRDWTFEPAIRGGKPVSASVQVPVDFKLETQ